MKRLNIDDKHFPPRQIRARIEDYKDKLIWPEEALAEASAYDEKIHARCYREYQEILRMANSMDFDDMILKNPSPNVMNGLARSILALYTYDDNPDDRSVENLMAQSVSLIARLPVIVAQTYQVKRHVYDGKSLYIHRPKDELSLAENFLRLIRKDKTYTPEEARLLDMMLILHAEHGAGNNSAFTCRAMSSSGTDTYSAIAGAVGSLKGPLHGGANAKVMEMFAYLNETVQNKQDDGELRDVLSKLLEGQGGDGSGKIYGLGHAVYTLSDPRAVAIKKHARSMAESTGRLEEFEFMERVERVGLELLMEKKKDGFPMCANVDFYSGFVYSMLRIPPELYTPLFATARIAGWCAHRIEELDEIKMLEHQPKRGLILSRHHDGMRAVVPERAQQSRYARVDVRLQHGATPIMCAKKSHGLGDDVLRKSAQFPETVWQTAFCLGG